METIRNGVVDIRARPQLVDSNGAFERWDGQKGPGNLNAHACMERAIVLSRQYGIGCVAMANTNHWMRGGSYGWQAADAGVMGICWTNTLPNVPPFAEEGLPNYAQTGYVGIMATGGTPEATIAKLNADINAVVKNSAVDQRMRQLGYEPHTVAFADAPTFFKASIDGWAGMIRLTGISAE